MSDTVARENINKNSSFIGKLVVDVMNDFKKQTNLIHLLADHGLKGSFLFSGHYTQWFIEFSKKDVLLLDFLLEYQREHRHNILSSFEERCIRDTYMDFLIDNDFPETFEATMLFTEIQLNTDDPPLEVKRCINSPHFLRVLKLAAKIGSTMKGYHSILNSLEVHNNLISAVDTLGQEVNKKPTIDVVRCFNTAISVLENKIQNINYSFKAAAKIPHVNIPFDAMIQMWLFVITQIIDQIMCVEKQILNVSINYDKQYIVIKIISSCEALDDTDQSMYIKNAPSREKEYQTIDPSYSGKNLCQFLDQYQGVFTSTHKQDGEIEFTIKFLIH